MYYPLLLGHFLLGPVYFFRHTIPKRPINMNLFHTQIKRQLKYFFIYLNSHVFRNETGYLRIRERYFLRWSRITPRTLLTNYVLFFTIPTVLHFRFVGITYISLGGTSIPERKSVSQRGADWRGWWRCARIGYLAKMHHGKCFKENSW